MLPASIPRYPSVDGRAEPGVCADQRLMHCGYGLLSYSPRLRYAFFLSIMRVPLAALASLRSSRALLAARWGRLEALRAMRAAGPRAAASKSRFHRPATVPRTAGPNVGLRHSQA